MGTGAIGRRGEINASKPWRVYLALAGLAVLLASALVLAYAFWPTGSVVEQFEPPATLFAPPQSLAGSEPWL